MEERKDDNKIAEYLAENEDLCHRVLASGSIYAQGWIFALYADVEPSDEAIDRAIEVLEDLKEGGVSGA